MKYDDLIQQARAQDAGPTPGPDFPALMAASVAARAGAGKTLVGWIFGVVGGAAVIAGVALAVGGDPTEDVETSARVDVVSAVVDGDEAPTPESEPVLEPRVSAPAEPLELEQRVPEAPEANDEARTNEARTNEVAGPRKATPTPEDPEALYRSSERHMASGALGSARRDLRRIVRHFPDWARHSTAMVDLARIEARMGKSQAAACSYRAFLDRYPRDMMAAEAKTALGRLEGQPGVDVGACR